MSYESGILDAASGCGGNIDHSVAAIGWGTDSKYGEYLIIRNSWGSQWGLNGYINVSMDDTANGGAGVCGIYTDVMQTTVF